MNNLHPHHQEEIEAQEYARAGAGYHDRHEAQNGARWNNDWQNEFILSSRDVWYSNSCYHGPKSPIHPEDDHPEAYEDSDEMKAYEAAYAIYWENESLWDAQLEDFE